MSKCLSRKTMQKLDALFDNLDTWRHFPNYQLERRADIFFSLYLVEALQDKFKFPIHPALLPEFPLLKSLVEENMPGCKSYKVDYVAFSSNLDKAILVELKTDQDSLNDVQNRYLSAAQEKDFKLMLDDLLKIFRATNSKRKYFCLLQHLAQIGLLHIPEHVHTIMQSTTLQGINEASHGIVITSKIKKPKIVYVQPNESNNPGETVITFNEFSKIVARHDDPLSQRFATSLKAWTIKAGNKS